MKIIYSLCFAIALFSCSNPIERKYSEATLSEDLKAIYEHDKPDSASIKGILGYMMLAAFTKENLTGKTYKEILALQKEAVTKLDAAQKEQGLLAAKALQEETEKRDKLGKVLTVAMYDKGFESGDYQKYLTYGLAFENKTDKDIRAVKGSLLINDLFDEKITSLTITYDVPLKAKSTAKESYTTDYNQFTDKDVLLRSKKIEDLKIIWNPEKIIFSDGTTLE